MLPYYIAPRLLHHDVLLFSSPLFLSYSSLSYIAARFSSHAALLVTAPPFLCIPLSALDVTGIDPYITATVREVRDSVGEAPEGGEEESNDVVSSDVRLS